MKQGCVEYAAYAEPEAGTGVASEPGSPVEVSGFVTVSSDFPLGVDPENDLDDPAEDHDPAANEIADEEAGPAGTVSDQPAVEERLGSVRSCLPPGT